ncbi:MAG TPA: molybdopterin dinucleotide binding domain-containing protein [Bacteroidota bacterium]|nr:molybdopterin dinucleotide binding domain-containing protein [Bacteroidota bacterium]
MNSKITRREVLQFVGGSALGVLLSPLPWKVLDDTAIWTQNWPWTPKPKRGDIAYRTTTCTLCQSSCGMRARTIGAQPVSLAGTQHHPFNQGALCTSGLLAHHLRYHPSRVKQALKFSVQAKSHSTLSADDAFRELSAVLKNSSSVVIVDERAGRTVSALYAELAASARTVSYAPVSARGISSLNRLAGNASLQAGYDVDNAKCILSFGAPLFDGWGTPSLAARFFDKRGTQKLIQIEPVRSRTAEMASKWIVSRPGTDLAAALSFAHVLLEERLVSASALKSITDIDELALFLGAFTPEVVSKQTGIPPATLRETARAIASQTPSVCVTSHAAGDDVQDAVMLLNILTGAVGTQGGITLRAEIPGMRSAAASAKQSVQIDDLPDHSVNVFILDESLSGSSIPDTLLQDKLVSGGQGVIISLSPFVTPRPFALQYIIPSTVMFETLGDTTGPFDAARSGLALSSALLPAPDGTLDALQFVQKCAETLSVSLSSTGSSEEILKKRIGALHASKRGQVFMTSTGETTDVKQLATADDLWNALVEGGCWIDEAVGVNARALSFRVMPSIKHTRQTQTTDSNTLLVYPIVESSAYSGKTVSPLMSKVSQESGLRLSAQDAYLNPVTAAAHQIEHGSTVALRTKNGTMNVRAKLDARTMPDVIFVSCTAQSCGNQSAIASSAQDVRLLCEVSSGGSYTPTPVTIQKVYL